MSHSLFRRGPPATVTGNAVARSEAAPLRRQRLMTALLAAFVLAVAVLSMLPESFLLSRSIPPTWQDLGHIPTYALLFVCATVVLSERGLGRWQAPLAAAALCLALGLLLEFLQPLTGRTLSALDMLRNLIGVSAGASVWAYRLYRLS